MDTTLAEYFSEGFFLVVISYCLSLTRRRLTYWIFHKTLKSYVARLVLEGCGCVCRLQLILENIRWSFWANC